MATSPKIVTYDDFYIAFLNEKVEPWTPRDLQIDSDREKALMDKMEKLVNALETSQFYHDFRIEVQSLPISEYIQRVLGSESKIKMVIRKVLGSSEMNMAIQRFLGSESKMNMVIYGVGSIDSDEEDDPKLQLSLAILMKRDFDWIGDIEVFDPILSKTEVKVLESLGCSVLSVNERGRRQAQKPTMFFMPHCDIMLYNNLVKANWEPNLLSNTIIFGNSFDSYIDRTQYLAKNISSIDPRKRILGIWPQMGHILAAQKFTNEFKMRTICYDSRRIDYEDESLQRYCEHSFFNLSWHFFKRPLTKTWMQLMRENTKLRVKLAEEREGRPVVPLHHNVPMAIVFGSYAVYFLTKRPHHFR